MCSRTVLCLLETKGKSALHLAALKDLPGVIDALAHSGFELRAQVLLFPFSAIITTSKYSYLTY